MKKAIALALFVVILISATAVMAETDRRGAFEFTELYTQRLCEYLSEYDPDQSITHGLEYVMDFGDTYYIISSAANLYIRKDDFSIVKASKLFMDLTKDDDDNKKSVMECIVAFSALEYSGAQDDVFKLTYKWTPEYEKSAVSQAIHEFNEIIFPLVNGEGVRNRILSGEVLKIYEGNYSYSLAYYTGTAEDGATLEFIDLIADEI